MVEFNRERFSLTYNVGHLPGRNNVGMISGVVAARYAE